MTGFASPDVPAWICYALITVLGALVAVQTINTLLQSAEDRWAFPSTWGLFLAYTAIPVALFWLLDYSGAVHDTSLFAAAVVGFGYRQIFAGAVQGITAPGQTAALWKPFEAWVDQVSKRISTKNNLYKDRFAEKVKSDLTRTPARRAKFETIVLANTDSVATLQAAVTDAAVETGNADSTTRRRVDIQWADLRRARPDLYGWILQKNGVVGPVRYWLWLDKGRAKLLSAAAIVLVLIGGAAAAWWLGGGPPSQDRIYTPMLHYSTWRFLKTNSTERDRWRSREYLTEELCAWGAERIPGVSEAAAQVDRTAMDSVLARRKADAAKVGSSERAEAEAAADRARAGVRSAVVMKRRAVAADIVLPRFLRELRYPDIPNARAGDILALLVSCHSPALNARYVPELIESLRQENEVVRLETRKALVALQVDYPTVTLKDELAKWEPKKSETPADLDQRVRQWRAWWSDTQAPPAPAPRGRPASPR